jgi:hypothetical protein
MKIKLRKADHGPVQQKRHGAAKLQDAVAPSRAPLFPPGFGVRQPHAALILFHCQAPSLLGLDAWTFFGAWELGFGAL